ncbi:MAG: hypothetical protein AB2637_01070, partial [Candidatus Thiodiazotropha sp.]
MVKRHYLSLMVFCLLSVVTATAMAAQRYDVSYVWSRNLNNVQDYRDQVARVLGPKVAKALKVVSEGDLYGLIYRRNGNSESTERVVESHTKLLRAKGLDAVSPVKARKWSLVGERS